MNSSEKEAKDFAEGLSLLYPAGYSEKKRRSKQLKNYDFIKTLAIDSMIIMEKAAFRGNTDLKLEDFFTDDEEVLAYRLDVVEDLVKYPKLYETFCKAVPAIQNVHDVRRSVSSDFSMETALNAIRFLEMYIEIVELFSDHILSVPAKSQGIRMLQERVNGVCRSEEFLNLKEELSKKETNFGLLKSVTIGVNLDEMLRAKDAGILSVNMEHFRSGTVMDRLLKKNDKNSMVYMTPMLPVSKGLHSSDENALNLSIRSCLNTVFMKTIKSFEPVIQKYYMVNTSWLVQLLDDIRFLTAGTRFILSMREKGFSMCKPAIAPMEEKRCDLEGVYNPRLAIKEVEKSVVSNRFSYDANGRFYLVTGPNHGGKSIFCYSIGIAQALFQLGLFIPARSARISPVTGIFTHFPESDEDNYGKGRLESECERLGEILKQLSDTDILLMDESFSSTSGMEAGYIASEVLTGIGVIGCGGIYVTHIHDLTQRLGEYNGYPGNRGKIDNLVAQMLNRENGVRSYRVERTTPDGLSYARDIAAKYGLGIQDILSRSICHAAWDIV